MFGGRISALAELYKKKLITLTSSDLSFRCYTFHMLLMLLIFKSSLTLTLSWFIRHKMGQPKVS